MKIGIATDVMTRGGVGTYVLALAAAARKRGYTVEVVVDASSASGIADQLVHDAFPVHKIRLYHRHHDQRAIEQDCQALLRERRFDSIHIALGIPWGCLALRQVARSTTTPFAVTECYVPESLELNESQRVAITASYEAARRVIFVSDRNRRVMSRLVHLDGVDHIVIPTGVSVREISDRSPSPALRSARTRRRRRHGRGAAVLAAARFTSQKGLDVLAEAVRHLRAALIDRVDVFGEGPDRELLESVASQPTGVPLTVHGWCDDIVAQFARHDLFVFPSRQEGMPITLLAAMAAGIPIVATGTSGVLEALGDGHAGFISPVGDPIALARTIELAANDSTEAALRANRAKQRVASRYDLAAVMRRTLAIWAA